MSDPQQLASFSPTVRGAISRRVILAAVVATVCVVLANLLALQNPARIVLSQSADHSLSPLTKNVLGALTNDVRAVVLLLSVPRIRDPPARQAPMCFGISRKTRILIVMLQPPSV